MCDEYNGWTNRETWAMGLYINNDQNFYYHANDLAAGYDQDTKGLEEALKEWVEEDLFSYENVKDNRDLFLMLTDIGSIFRVNWKELAQSFIEANQEEVYA